DVDRPAARGRLRGRRRRLAAGGGGGGDRGLDGGRGRPGGSARPGPGRADPPRRTGRPGAGRRPGLRRAVGGQPQPSRADAGTYRAGFACFVGRPNAGKSTLVNAIIGQKIAITSSRPQTTRHVIRGVLHRPDAQLVLVDTPGMHRPRTLLGQRLNELVRQTWSEVDVIGLCLPANERVGPGDRFISGEIAGLRATVIAVVTKSDLVGPARLAEQLVAVADLGDFAEVVPVSAVTGYQ